MNLPQFVYTRRWLVIGGLAVTLMCLIAVLYWVSIYKPYTADSKAEKQSTSSAEVANESTSSATPSPTLNSNISLGSTAPANLTTAAEATMLEVEAALEAKDGQKLYDLLAKDIKEMFTVESVTAAFAQADGLTISPINEMQINSEWAKLDVESVDAAGKMQQFRVVLHLENGTWKLFGTELIS